MEKSRRSSLSAGARQFIRWKTNGHCHICGGPLGKKWTADHVVPYAHGGVSSIDNYLPACKVCNGLRWSYRPAQIRRILELGIYAKREIHNGTPLGKELESLYKRRRKQNRKR